MLSLQSPGLGPAEVGFRLSPPSLTMPRDPHGCVPEKAEVVLLLVDVINHFDFPRASHLLRFALPAARRLRALKERLKKKSVPAVYVNDNFGRWRSDFKKQVQDCIKSRSPGAEIASLLMPEEDDYFVLKPKHSGFFSTALDVLLRYLGAKRLIIAGFAADIRHLRPFPRQRRTHAGFRRHHSQ
jgi:nicotinamidase-related amidase